MNYKRILKQINKLAQEFESLSDKNLKEKTKELKVRINSGEPALSIVIEAFATVREADRRVLHLYPTDEQILGGLALYDGNIAEIKTGEGKSLVATMPLYLKALYMGRAFLVTTNNYLANRDYIRIGKVYKWLGLKVANASKEFATDYEEDDIVKKKKEIYFSDIIYISNSTLGFDFLINGLAEKKEDQFIPPLTFALIDEVDEILLDSAQQPLIISGAPKVQSNYFQMTNLFVKTLQENIDYKRKSYAKEVWLTELGIENLKKYFSSIDLLDKSFFLLYQHIILALKANYIFQKNKDYIIEDGKLMLLDSKDGRIKRGMVLQNGLHQALETKESLELSLESQTISSITFQNLFRSFQQLSGMTGTAKSSESEFINTYNLSVKKIKPRKKNIRVDHKPQQFVTAKTKLTAVCQLIKDLNNKKRPLLIIADTVGSSELLSIQLFDMGISHNLLNAKSSVKEAQIIKEAGEVGAVTVSTAMAGRGTDIKLTNDAIKEGGLAVIITERLSNKRTELQAKGRAGRQGEPGDTYVFESLEDQVMKQYMQEKIQSYYDKHRKSDKQIKKLSMRRSFKQAQDISEEQDEIQRIKSLQFDDVQKIQKNFIDKSREKILKLESIDKAVQVVKDNVYLLVSENFYKDKLKNTHSFQRFMLDNIDYNFKTKNVLDSLKEIDEIIRFVLSCIVANLELKRKKINNDEVFLVFLKTCMLKALDYSWANQVNNLDALRYLVQHRSIVQQSPILEFEKESKKSYEYQRKQLIELLVKNVALTQLEINDDKLTVVFP